MVIVIARIKIHPEKVEEFKQAAAVSIAATRKENGCLSYNLLEDAYEKNTFCFVDEWESPAALAAHGQSPHVTAFMADMKAKYELSADVKLYEGTPLP